MNPGTPRGALERLGHHADVLASAMSAVAGWGYFAIGGLIVFDVIARATLGFSSRATLELSGYLLAIGISWSLAHAFTERSHVRVDMLVNRLPLRWRVVMHIVAILLLAVVSCFFAWGGVQLALESFDFGARDRSALETPLGVPQAIWAFGLLFFSLRLMLALVSAMGQLVARDFPGIDARYGPRTYEEEAAETLEAVPVTDRPR